MKMSIQTFDYPFHYLPEISFQFTLIDIIYCILDAKCNLNRTQARDRIFFFTKNNQDWVCRYNVILPLYVMHFTYLIIPSFYLLKVKTYKRLSKKNINVLCIASFL